MSEFCDFVDCSEQATVIVEGKNVCYIHAIKYQADKADRDRRNNIL